ncbi:MAG TPA: cytochrome c oxidase assembly protein [Acidimicrobiales bacterium]|nr:cytochrome c oxidase assembly protein [Acidimicrobiales bacterium]
MAGDLLAATGTAPLDWGRLGATRIDLFLPLFVALGAAYVLAARLVGERDPGSRWSSRRTLAFLLGLLAALVATDSVIGVYEDTLFYVHMIQHLLLIMVAAPLLAMGAPAELCLRATSGRAHAAVERALSSKVAEVAAHPVVDFVLYAFLIPVCHLTGFFNLTLQHPVVLWLEHLLFLAVGYLFWRHVVAIEPSRHRLHPGVRLLFLALAVPVDTFTGLTLASAAHEMFPAYAAQHRTWGPSLVLDLHIGGDVMWVGGDVLMFLGMVPVAVLWVRHEERRALELDRQLDAAREAWAAGDGPGPLDPVAAPSDDGGRGEAGEPSS